MTPINSGKILYEIILLKNNECVKTFSMYRNLPNCIEKFNSLINENKKSVIFSQQYNNIEKIEEVKYHLAIIKRKDKDSIEAPQLKNDLGQFVNHIIVDNDEWEMFQKEEYLVEESFWVYGFNPLLERKDFKFIYNNLIKPYATNKYNFINITFYKNKLLLESNNQTDLILCKNKDDAFKMYALIDDMAKIDKLKHIMFSGDGGRNRKESVKMIEKIQKLTHWDNRKITRHTT